MRNTDITAAPRSRVTQRQGVAVDAGYPLSTWRAIRQILTPTRLLASALIRASVGIDQMVVRLGEETVPLPRPVNTMPLRHPAAQGHARF